MKEKIKILHIIPVFATGGAERLVLHYARLFEKQIYEIHVASCVEDGELRLTFENIDAVHVFVGSRHKMGGRRAVYRQLEQYVLDIKPDIVHTHMISADYFGFSLKKKLKDTIRWISTMHNVETATSWPRQMLWRYILKRADRVISVSYKVEKFTRASFHISASASRVLLNGIDSEHWLTIPMSGLFTKKRMRIASVGRLWKQKGHTYLLHALAQLHDIDFEMHMFGDGPLRDELKKQAHDLGLDDRVIWHGVVSDIPARLKNIDLVIQPSLWEGLSLVVMEMMSAGRPVITTPAGGDELITPGETGYIVPSQDADALADIIRQVIADPVVAKRVAQQARIYAQKHFDIAHNVSGLQNIYQDVLC